MTITLNTKTADKIERIIELIRCALNKDIKLPDIPTILTAYATPMLDGMSAERVASKVISRQGEFGGYFQKNMPSGAKYMMNQLIVVLTEEIIDELQLHARIDAAAKIGAAMFTGTGGNAGGPVEVTGTNIEPIKISGGIH